MANRSTLRSHKYTQSFVPIHTWNIGLAIIFGLEAIAMLILSAPHDLPIDVSFLGKDSLQTKLQGTTVTSPAIHQLFMINVVYLVASALIIGSLVHVFAATKLRERYETMLRERNSGLHTFQYVAEGLCLFVAVSLLAGIYDLSTLLLIIVVAVILGITLAMVTQQKLTAIRYFAVFLAVLALFIVVGLIIMASWTFGEGAVGFPVLLIFLSVLAMAVLLALNNWLIQSRKGKWSDIIFAERTAIVLNGGMVTLVGLLFYLLALHP